MKVSIKKIYRSDKTKEGALLKTRDGRPFTRCSIQTYEYGDKWISGFGNSENETWTEGQVVDIEIEQKGEYLNFKTLNKQVTRQEFDELKTRISALEERMLSNGYNSQSEIPDEDAPPF